METRKSSFGLLSLWCVVFMVSIVCPVLGTTYYVDASKPAGGNGLTWATAFNTIQAAVNAANPVWMQCYAPLDTIYVKQGTYVLTSTLTLGSGDELYGGFPSSIANPVWADRDWKTYPTVIDGNNSVRCVTMNHYSMLDGFTIQNGSASTGAGISVGAAPIDCGFLGYMSPIVQNCRIRNNTASGSAGGLFDDGADVHILDCEFSGNSAGGSGGAIYYNNSGTEISRCTFFNNETTPPGSLGGGAVAGYGHNGTTGKYVTITNCLFYANASNSWGGAISGNQTYPTITNCTFADNTAVHSGGAFYGQMNSEAPRIRNSICWNNSPDQLNIVTASAYLDVSYCDIQGGWTGAGSHNINLNPLFVGGTNYRLQTGSPCIDTGSNAYAPADDLDGQARPQDGDDNGSAVADMGAYEVKMPGPPAAPTNLQATVISPQIHVTWQDNADDETGYKVQYKRWSRFSTEPVGWTAGPTLGTNCTSYQHDSATYNYYYKFRVRATNSYGDSDWSNEQSVLVGLYLYWIRVTHPDGGEKLAAGATREITWTTGTGITSVTIDYSTDGGSTWRSPAIVTGTPNDGSYLWTIPNTVSDTCVLRIRDAADGSPYDLSNAPFSIVPAAPDLVVKSINLVPETPVIRRSYAAEVAVKNQGSVDAGGFWVDWFADRNSPPLPGEYSTQYQWVANLAAGAEQKLSFSTVYPLPGDYTGFAVADTSSRVTEADEDNNVGGPFAVHVNEFEFKQETNNASAWFGGDDNTVRNLAYGQSFTLPRSAYVEYAGFRLLTRFDYHYSPSGTGHAVTLVMNVRAADGTILKSITKSLPASFDGGWVLFDVDMDLWGGQTYLFTWYLQDGQTSELSSSIAGRSDNPWPDSQGYRAIVNASPFNMEDWSKWQTHSWDFNFWIIGDYSDLSDADFSRNYGVGLEDFAHLASRWLRGDCVLPSWCEQADLNYSGAVDIEDLQQLSEAWLWRGYGWLNFDRIFAMEYEVGPEPISGANLEAGSYVIYRTNQYRWGKFIVEKLDTASNTMTIGWTTYNNDGTVYSMGTGLDVSTTVRCDLDSGVLGDNDKADWYWLQTNPTTQYLYSTNAALFKLIYRAP